MIRFVLERYTPDALYNITADVLYHIVIDIGRVSIKSSSLMEMY